MPRFSEDDVLDFLVVEALTARGIERAQEEQKNSERQQFRDSHKGFDPTAPRGG